MEIYRNSGRGWRGVARRFGKSSLLHKFAGSSVAVENHGRGELGEGRLGLVTVERTVRFMKAQWLCTLGARDVSGELPRSFGTT